MKGKRLIAVFLTLMLMISVMMPSVSAREFSRSGNTASSWDATQTNDSYSDDSNEEVDASTETPAAEDETPAAEDETPAAEDENPGSKEENPAEGSDPESDPSEEMPPSEEETNDENMPDSSENDDLPPLAEDGIELYASSLTAYLVDEDDNPVGNETTPINGNQYTDWTSVRDVAPTIDGYDFVRAYTSYSHYNETTVTYIRYINRGWYSSWRYSTSQSNPNDYNSGSLSSIYFVYKANDGKVTLTFNTNDGSGSVDPIRGEPGTTVTLPEYGGTRHGYTFIGWTTAAVTFPNDTAYPIYTAGSDFEMPEDSTTLYAAWASVSQTTGMFFIRLDGIIPSEPSSYPTTDYTTKIVIQNAIQVQYWVIDNSAQSIEGNHAVNDVSKSLNALPTDEQITNVYPEYDPETQYVLWYVQKYDSSDGWHIDGVLLNRAMVNITYSPNVPAGTDVLVPSGYQVTSGTTVTVGQSGKVGGDMEYASPTRVGYKFIGWNTKADGSGTMYQPNDTFELTADTTLYAQWSKTGNALTLTKVDGLGYTLDGASFTISSGTSTNSFTAGTYTNNKIYTDTVYTITETKAPEGYEGLTESFRFIVKSDGSSLDAYLCDENGDKLSQNPEGVKLSYQSGTVNITVTNIGYFYVYHSSNQSVDTIAITEENLPNGKFDITAKVKDGYLYGGYYRDYLKAGSYMGGATPTEDGTNYTGAIAGYWNSDDAYNKNGTKMSPVAGTTYYLKEVPERYFRPAMIVVYDTYTTPSTVKKLYLISATDDKNYKEFGLIAQSTYDQEKEFGAFYTVQQDLNVSAVSVLTANNVFGVPAGYLGVWNANNEVTANNSFTYTPYVVTPDGVTVYGTTRRTVSTGNLTYNGTLEAYLDDGTTPNPGIYKQDEDYVASGS